MTEHLTLFAKRIIGALGELDVDPAKVAREAFNVTRSLYG